MNKNADELKEEGRKNGLFPSIMETSKGDINKMIS